MPRVAAAAAAVRASALLPLAAPVQAIYRPSRDNDEQLYAHVPPPPHLPRKAVFTITPAAVDVSFRTRDWGLSSGWWLRGGLRIFIGKGARLFR